MAQVIVISSLNSRSGKTLLAAHLAVMLARDYKTAILGPCGTDSPLALFIAKRHTLNLGKNYDLPVPRCHPLQKDTFDTLCREADAVILDSPDAKYFQYTDILITPVTDKEGIGAVCDKNSLYASLVWEAKKKRAAAGKNAFRWIICPNGGCSPENLPELQNAGRLFGFAVSPQLSCRREYADGLKHGITVLDKDRPALKGLFGLPDLYARRELKKLADFIWQNK